MLSFLIGAIVFILPLRWAANYSDASKASYLNCLIVSVVTGLIQAIIAALLSGSPYIAWLIGAIVMLILCMKMLDIPGSNFVMFAVMLCFLNVLLMWLIYLMVQGLST